ncbi:MAG: hypothetical protein WCC22_06565 [Terriglobales bacterium]
MNAAPSSPVSLARIALVCPQCQSSMPAGAAFCPGCGRAIKRIPLADRAVAALAYLTLAPAAALLLLPAYRRRTFVRFHAWQSVLLWGAFCLLTIASLFLSNIAAAIEFLLFGILALLAMFFLWVVLSLKAWQGERFELPIFGMLAGRLR